MSHPEKPQNMPIAIVGVSALFPGSVEREGFWRDIVAGRDRIEDVPASHWLIEDYYDPDPTARDKVYAKRGGFLPEVTFDPMQWGVPPTIMPATDTTQLLALIVAQRVLDDAIGDQFGEALRKRTSIILGVTSAQELLGTMVSRLQRPVWQKALRDMGLPDDQVTQACDRIADHYVEWQESTFPGVLGNVVAGRIANRLDLGGTNCVTDAACASSFSAISMGINELRLGSSDLVIAGGADTMNDIFMYMCFSKTPALSATGDCRPFSDRADGTLLGEGIGMFALMRLEDAEAQGHHVYAVLRGLGSSSDGRSKSVYAPVSKGQAHALERAYEQAGYSPAGVELVEAHGTGTKAGDLAEVGGLSMVFENSRDQAPVDGPWCALGSIKSQIGHTKAAAGAAGLFKVVMALHHKTLPPTIKVDAPNPALELERSPFYLNTEARPWIRRTSDPRRASVSSFGFGGSNYHITLEEHLGQPRPARLRAMPQELVLLTADSPESLADLARTTSAEAGTSGMLRYLAYRSQHDFDAAAPCRLAVLAEDERDLADKLDNAATMVAEGKPFRSPTGIHFGRGEAEGGLAMIFPGQGSQYLGMGGALAIAYGEAIDGWDEANTIVPGLGDVVFPPPAFTEEARRRQEATLVATEWAQPAIGAASLALWRLLQALELEGDAYAGHSFGEIMALHAAGVLSAADALGVARRRGELMAEAAASSSGAMLSVRADLAEVEPLLGEGVSVANHNAPRQVVISGISEAIDATARRLKEAGLSTKRLAVATAFHSPVVAEAVAPFRRYLDQVAVSSATAAVSANSSAAIYEADPEAVRDRLAGQIAERVRFVEQIEAMYADGIRTFVEVGPGHVITQLVGRILADRDHRAVALDRRGRDATVSLHEGLAQLAVAGRAIQFSALWRDYAEPVDPRRQPAPKMAVTLTGTSYGKIYPPAEDATTLPTPPRASGPREEARGSAAPAATPTGRIPKASPPAPSPPAALPPSPPPAAQPSPPPSGGATLHPDWLRAFEIAQQQAAAAQESFQRTLAESHANYLRESQANLSLLGQLLGGDAAGHRAESPVATPAGAAGAAPPNRPAVASAVVGEHDPQASIPSRDTSGLSPKAPPEGAEEAPLVERAIVQGAERDLTAVMLEVVAEATGYPAEMLGLDMDLEADLGIDSIKRVEILSALKKRAPDLPDVPTAEIAKLSTLGAVLSSFRGRDASPAGDVPRPAADANSTSETSASGAAPRDVEALVLDAVSDKTGYPVQMLGLEMELEADLGIDSIKRVEILSAVRNQAPDLPDFPTRELAGLKTLGAVVDRMRNVLGAEPADPAGGGEVSIEATPSAEVARSKPTAQLERRVTELMAAEAPGVATPGLRSARAIAVTEDGQGLASALCDRLVGVGLPACVVTGPEALPAETGAVILLAPPGESDQTIAGRAIAYARRGGSQLSAAGGALITVQRTGGDLGTSGRGEIASASLMALARTARKEWPQACVRGIDLGPGADALALAVRLADELLVGGATPEVALTEDGQRLVPRDVTKTAPKGDLLLGPDDVVVASGGGRGVTAEALVALAEESRAGFLLLGRSPLVEETPSTLPAKDDAALKRLILDELKQRGVSVSPAALGRRVSAILASRAVRATVAAIEGAGGRALYAVADVTDPDAVARAVSTARAELGPVTAIVHGAGVIADKAIVDKKDDQVQAVLATKVAGLDALLEATEGEPLRVVCLFSSVAARYGNEGQADYAMANELLNKRARALAVARPELTVRSIGWGPWHGGMVSPSLAGHFAAQGVELIDLAAGAKAFVDELRGSESSVEVLLGAALPAPEAAPSGPTEADVFVDPTDHAYLSDHRIRGQIVLPVALAVELFGRACRSSFPELHLQRLSTLKVLKGIVLDDFERRGAWLRIGLEQVSNGDGATVSLALMADGDRPRYTAMAELGREPAASAWISDEDGKAGDDGAGKPVSYGGVLFHGPRLQVLDALTALDRRGAHASMIGRHFSMDGFSVDVGLIDGALQLALLWTDERLDGASLPTSVGQIEVHRPGPVEGMVHATLRARDDETGRGQGVCDLHLRSADGLPLYTLRAVETHLLPAPASTVRAPRP